MPLMRIDTVRRDAADELADSIGGTFAWRHTVQGHRYWSEVTRMLYNLHVPGNSRPEGSRLCCTAPWDREAAVRHEGDLGIRQDRVDELAERLNEAFIWAETPQGCEYWDTVYTNLRNLYGED